ncbi:GnsA/GnsB family [Raoultella planticola]|uniref:GnsA/GnsB family n=1 Tax=Raoultella planticola TaxID=575 RepID=A0A485AJ96_RAOPL|nr:GnsA/GnsB family [Raoultella planticola]
MKSEELTRKAEEEISALISKKVAELRKKTGKKSLKLSLLLTKPCRVLTDTTSGSS